MGPKGEKESKAQETRRETKLLYCLCINQSHTHMEYPHMEFLVRGPERLLATSLVFVDENPLKVD